MNVNGIGLSHLAGCAGTRGSGPKVEQEPSTCMVSEGLFELANTVLAYNLVGQVAVHMMFGSFFFLLIGLNTLTLTIESNDLNEEGEFAMQLLNWFFTIMFTVELAIKWLAFGKLYFADRLNVFDFLIVLVSWLEIAIKGGSESSTISVLRTLRGLRLARMLKVTD